MSGQPDNEVPEVFLGGFIAPRLFDTFGCPVHVEHNYLTVAKRLGIEVTPGLKAEVDNLHADLALYPQGAPPAIVELKILDEGGSMAKVLKDVARMRKLADACAGAGGIDPYVGVLVCETRNAPMRRSVDDLERELGARVRAGGTQRSADDKWDWCFACASPSFAQRAKSGTA